MSQACHFATSETKNNPLYKKMRERFSMGGSMTIGEYMLNRANRAGASVESVQATPVVETIVKSEAKRTPSRFNRMQRHHAAALSCVLLAFVAVSILVVLLSSYTGLSITASPAGSDDTVVSGNESPVVPAPETEVLEGSSFENVLQAMDRSFGK